jgi:hypothetical protein
MFVPDEIRKCVHYAWIACVQLTFGLAATLSIGALARCQRMRSTVNGNLWCGDIKS